MKFKAVCQSSPAVGFSSINRIAIKICPFREKLIGLIQFIKNSQEYSFLRIIFWFQYIFRFPFYGIRIRNITHLHGGHKKLPGANKMPQSLIRFFQSLAGRIFFHWSDITKNGHPAQVGPVQFIVLQVFLPLTPGKVFS
ncbi:hypothetical protein D3C86_1612880 [compost metagenome]